MKKPMKCPVCGRRLFDLVSGEAVLEIKCTGCKNIVLVNGKNVEIVKA